MKTERVIFRKWRGVGDIIALFPDQEERHGCIGSYMHVGQHSPASYPLDGTVPATPDEYADLLAELVRIGYDNLRIVTRVTRSRK